jgi:NAD(P)-dependent dehydrogenase (short-subunit alcohol dehydrogenase family)
VNQDCRSFAEIASARFRSDTGGGRVTAQLFAVRGWNVAATARNSGSPGIWTRLPNVLPPALDVTNEESIRSSVTATAVRFGPHCQCVSSAAGRFGSAFLSPYTASKYAIEGLSESLRFELKAFGVRVKMAEPGHFRSDFRTRNLRWSEHSAYEPQLSNIKAWVAQSPDGAPDPEGVAEVVYKAATDRSGQMRYLTNERLLPAMHGILPDLLWRSILSAGMNRSPKGLKPRLVPEPEKNTATATSKI